MASLTILTTDLHDQAIAYATARYNDTNPASEADLTPRQFFERHILHKLESWVREFLESSRATRGELYTKATAEDQAAVDAILDKYRTT